MSSYDSFRNEMAKQLLVTQQIDTTQQVLTTMDIVAAGYNIEPKCTDLIVAADLVPELVRIYIAAKAVEGKSQTTLNQYLYGLSKFFVTTRLRPDAVTANDIRIYLYTYQKEHKISNASLDGLRSIIATFFSWCVNEDYLEKNPAKKVQPIKHQKPERPYMTPLELEIVRNACRTPKERAIVEFLYSTGCRVSEACAVRLDDINLTTMDVIIRHGKGDKRRITYLSAAAVVAIEAYLKTREIDSPYLFGRKRKRLSDCGVSPRLLQTEVAEILARTNLSKKITPHVFRHTTATVAVRSGMPIDQVQRLMGHCDIGTTMIYAKSDDADVKRSHAKFIA